MAESGIKPVAEISAWKSRCHAVSVAISVILSAVKCGAEISTNSLPPPAGQTVDFNRDIRPIFEESCYRCHGPERPKSHFRLDDRQSALKGGDDNTDDIIPGDSARSQLIHYVAQLVPDREMPPHGKGEPLSAAKIALLRAWIDQGAAWGATNTGPQLAFAVEPAIRWIQVDGKKSKFREIEGIKDGIAGGVEYFSMTEQVGAKKVTVEGHVLVPDQDYQVKLRIDRTDVGFLQAGFEQWRKYYNDAGGYDPAVNPPAFELNRDLFVDNGRAWIDLGLTMPNLPQVLLGYEYQYRNGTESTLDWGAANGKNIYPATQNLDEQTHTVKLELSQDIEDWHVADSVQIEIYRESNLDNEANIIGGGPSPTQFIHSRDDYHHVQAMNTLSIQNPVFDWWLLSAAFYASVLDGDYSFAQTTTDAAGAPVAGNFWRADGITLRRQSDVLSAASLFTPLQCLSLSVGAQTEWTREEGFGNAELDAGDPNNPAQFFLFPVTLNANLDEFKASQNALLRFTRIPFTVLFADARLQQDSIGQFDQETGNVPQAFLRNTDYSNDRYDVRTGFNTSPWRWIDLNAQYRHLSSDSDYNHTRDSTVGAYPAFILARKIDTDQVDARLTFRPARWLKTSLTYQIVASDYTTRTDPVPGGISPGGSIFAGNADSHNFGVTATVTPLASLYLSGTFVYSDSRLVTAADNNPAIVPYRGDGYNAMASATYAINKRTQLSATYSFSYANYGQKNAIDGVPLGIDYSRHAVSAGLSRKINEHVSASLRYAYYRYSEPTFGGLNDYTAQGVFATVAVLWH